jgi:hypothetical protein
VIPAAVVLAAAVAAWGAVAPAPELPPPAVVPPVTPPAAIESTIIAKAPVDVRTAPALVAAPRARPEPPPRPLYKDWRFWVIAGGLFATTVILTIAETRPGPEPYTGNVPPYSIRFP